MFVNQREVIDLVFRSLNEDMPIYDVMKKIERSIILNASLRHKNLDDAHKAIKIPRTTFFKKRREYEQLFGDQE